MKIEIRWKDVAFSGWSLELRLHSLTHTLVRYNKSCTHKINYRLNKTFPHADSISFAHATAMPARDSGVIEKSQIKRMFLSVINLSAIYYDFISTKNELNCKRIQLIRGMCHF